MKSHLNLPWHWIECNDPNSCFKALHLDLPSKQLNECPVEWVETLVGNCEITDNFIAFYDEDGEYHNENGPALEVARGTKYWFIHGVTRNDNGPTIMNSPHEYT